MGFISIEYFYGYVFLKVMNVINNNGEYVLKDSEILENILSFRETKISIIDIEKKPVKF